MPLQECVRFEEEHDLTDMTPSARGQTGQVSSEENQGEFLPAGNAWHMRLFPAENLELLTEEKDFEIFATVSLTTQPDEVEEQ